MSTVVGLFETRDQAQRAVEALKRAGFRAEDMSIVMRDRDRAADVAADVGTTGEAAAAGAVGGGLLGGFAGLLVGVGALAIPGIGPLVAAGPIASILAGGALGAATGGLLGALTSAGVPEDEAEQYQAGVERGGILLTVQAPEGREAEARSILGGSGMRDLSYHRSRWEQDPDFQYDIDRSTDMASRKTPKKDEATVDAKAGGVAVGGTAGAVVGGAVGGPVGAGVGAVVGAAAGGAAGAAMDDWGRAEPEFRQEWERGPYKASSSWDDASEAYHYGWETYDRPEYRGQSWDQVSSHLQANWRGRGQWSDYAPMVKSAWERRANRALQAGEKAVVPVVEEELEVGKRKVQTGGVRVETKLTETPVEEQVRLHEEHVRVERRPTDRAVTEADVAALQGGTIEVAETAEKAVVDKKARVVEEVVIDKEARDRTETVRDTVRRTDVDVDQVKADADVKATETGHTTKKKNPRS